MDLSLLPINPLAGLIFRLLMNALINNTMESSGFNQYFSLFWIGVYLFIVIIIDVYDRKRQQTFWIIRKDIVLFFKRLLNKFRVENLKYEYINFDLENLSTFKSLLSRKDIFGMNVTIPYKQEVISFLDELDPIAKAIGAVNTIVFKDDKRLGFNTDHIGFQNTLLNHLKPHHNKALVLGTGGASKAVCYVLEQLKIKVLKVSRSEGPDRKAYHQLSAKVFKEHSFLVNCTPRGTHPNAEASPPSG